LFWATTSQNTDPEILQLPFLRVLIQGRLGVSIFAFVTGYVCALKPLKLYRQDRHEAAFVSISKSALRRFPRLFLPSAAATVLSWVMCELGLYSVAKHADSSWINQVPPRMGSFFPAVGNLVYETGAIWIKRSNDYDRNQWTMLPLLQESIKVYAFLLAVAYIRPRYRMLASFAVFAYYWMGNDRKYSCEQHPAPTVRPN
jgi:peptidoglycan/LPS O-acetylase OafA/YrhL